jgi:hypothetical protein
MKCPLCLHPLPSRPVKEDVIAAYKVIGKYFWHMLIYMAGGYILGRYL